MGGKVFEYGDRVILVTETGNRFSFLIRKGQLFHSTDGYFKADDIGVHVI
jgi:tRNA A58 N-methylase Trm61